MYSCNCGIVYALRQLGSLIIEIDGRSSKYSVAVEYTDNVFPPSPKQPDNDKTPQSKIRIDTSFNVFIIFLFLVYKSYLFKSQFLFPTLNQS